MLHCLWKCPIPVITTACGSANRPVPQQREEVRNMRDEQGRGIAELARLFGGSPNTIRRA